VKARSLTIRFHANDQRNFAARLVGLLRKKGRKHEDGGVYVANTPSIGEEKIRPPGLNELRGRYYTTL